ncbi:APC family permease [Sulfurimonas sp.]|uniref:APC family permease n=1 Tax=Sulfurimonas sp. TaxID=2022749 RepID=UPI002608B293|nr:APC family permease [Sulfurimonas sp.]
MNKQKAFGVWSAVFLGIGSMVGAGIFIVIGQAGSMAGNIVWLSFVFGGIIALLSGYSLAKLAVRYQSRGGIVEYLVQGFGENLFSGSLGVMFYFSQLVAIAAVAKSFGTYSATFLVNPSTFWINSFAVGIVALFTLINLIGASFVSKSENFIVILKVGVLIFFAIATLFTIKPELLSITDMPPISGMFFAIGITFFAYQGFSVITNTVEDMKNPQTTMIKSMFVAIIVVALLYIITSISVLGNLPLSEIIKTKDYALAEAAKPLFGEWGFKIMAVTALLATASAINATLYAVSDIGYTMAKEGNLPDIYEYNVLESFEGLIISSLLIIPMILFFNISQITTVAAIVMLIVQGSAHIAHLNLIKETGAKKSIVILAIISMFGVAGITLYSTYKIMPEIAYYLIIMFALAFSVEYLLRYFSSRTITKQTF